MKKVFKYGTGQEIPKGAIYLHTLVEEKSPSFIHKGKVIHAVRLVWHYFLVEVRE